MGVKSLGIIMGRSVGALKGLRPQEGKGGAVTRGAFTGFVQQIVPDKVPNMFHFIEFKAVFVFCAFFLCQIARGPGVDPP